MNKITITNQTEWDALPKSFDIFTIIKIDAECIKIHSIPGSSTVEARGSSTVVARGSSRVEARDSSTVVARGSSRVVASDSSTVVAWGSSRVEVWDSSTVEARDSSTVVARGSSRATYDNELLLKYFEISPIGSRNDILKIYICTKTVKIRTGCFSGSIDYFTAAVAKSHIDDIHAKSYMVAIEFIKNMVAIYQPTEAQP